jgi:hypothetical protein
MPKSYTAGIAIFLFFFAVACELDAADNLAIDLEAGIAFTGYNDIRIPGKSGSDISFKSDLESEDTEFFRARVIYGFNSNQEIIILAAPLRIRATGRIDRDIRFVDAEFAAGSELDGRYRFDSYRLSYRYFFHSSDRAKFGAGLTAKVRDAEISLSGDGKFAEKKNTGFVPLINFYLYYKISESWGILLEGDALAAPQGRAEDILAGLTYKLNDRIGMKAGYRLLEGGADNDEVYTFAMVNYLAVGATISFGR